MGTLWSLSESATNEYWYIAVICAFLFGSLFLCSWLAEEFAKSEKWKARHMLLVTLAIIGVAGEQIFTLIEFVLSEHLQQISESKIDAERLKADKLERANLELRKALEPRQVGVLSINNTKLTGGLDRFNETRMLVQAVPEWESQKLAALIIGVVEGYGWKAIPVNEAVTTIPPILIPDGISVYSTRSFLDLQKAERLFPDMPEAKPPFNSVERQTTLAGETLRQYLSAFNLSAVHWPTDRAKSLVGGKFKLPPDAILVLVGSNPNWKDLYLPSVEASMEDVRLTEETIIDLQIHGPFPFRRWP